MTDREKILRFADGQKLTQVLRWAASRGITGRRVRHVLHDAEYDGHIRLDFDRVYHLSMHSGAECNRDSED